MKAVPDEEDTMSCDALGNASPSDTAIAGRTDNTLSADVNRLIGKFGDPSSVERRARTRYPIPYTFQLIPLDEAGKPRLEKTTTVVGKQLSQSGISFSHDQPLSCRGAIVSLIHPNIGRFAVEVDLLWTRRTIIGIYESGGRLIRTVRGHSLWTVCARRSRDTGDAAASEPRQ